MATKSIISNTKMHTLAQAISAKGGASLPMTVDQMAAAVAAIPTGGGGDTAKSIFFIDYDGTILHSYDIDEFSAMADLPANPSHSGLTAQGWNWTKAGIEAQLAAYPEGVVWVGQKYITDDGKTRIYVRFEEGRHEPFLGLAVNGTVEIDWGDGSAADTLTGTSLTYAVTIQHVYASPGEYVIKLTVLSGSFAFIGNSTTTYLLRKGTGSSANPHKAYSNAVQKIEFGRNASIGSYAFYNCYSLTYVTLPDGITAIGYNAFAVCYSLASVTVPDGVTSIAYSAFSTCHSLARVSVPGGVTSIEGSAFKFCYSLASITIPREVTSIEASAFDTCCSLKSVIIPDGVTTIWSSTFNNCNALASITLPKGLTNIVGYAFNNCRSLANIEIPDGVTNIGGSAFNTCYSLASIKIPNEVKSIGSNAFYSCYSLNSVKLPDGVTSIGYGAFNSCYSLGSIEIPDGVTSIEGSAFNGCYSLGSIKIPDGVTVIKSYMFYGCYSLDRITIPEGVTSIESNAFNSCYGVSAYYLLPKVPPTLANTNAFGGIEPDCIIYVPAGTLAAYQAATNWSTYASYMREAAAA